MLKINKFQGINLVEMLLALVIIAILALVAMPTFNNLINRYRISGSAEQLQHFLEFARSEAIKRNITVYVSFRTGDTWCYGANLSSACNCETPNNCGLGVVSYNTAGQITLSTSGMSSNSVAFQGSHGAADNSCSVTLTQYGAASPLMTIAIGRLGYFSKCSTGIGGYTAC